MRSNDVICGPPEASESSVAEVSTFDRQPDLMFLDGLLVLAKHRRIIGKIVVVCAVISAIVSLLLPVHYTAIARILAPKESQSISSLMLGTQLGGLAALASGGGLSVKDPNDMYVSMLKSRTIADHIIKKFELQKIYQKKTEIETVKQLGKYSAIGAGPDSIITIEVEDRDPNRAAGIANMYVNELSNLTTVFLNRNAIQRRAFLGEQLEKARQDLGRAEAGLRSTQERTGMIQVNEQGRAIIEFVAKLRAQIGAKEVELQTMRSFATAENPDVVRTESELRTLRIQLSRLERNGQLGDGNVFVPTGKVPSVGQEYSDKLRQVKYSELLLELIAKQYEIARLDESNNISAIQILDQASVPEKKSKPKRGLIVFLSTIVGIFLAIAFAFWREYLERLSLHPEGYDRIQRLRIIFNLRSRLRTKSA